MIPGRRNVMRIQADRPGVFGGQCAEYCGGPHALMGFTVVAHEPATFARMMEARLRRETMSQAPPSAGARLFDTAGCSACHRIAARRQRYCRTGPYLRRSAAQPWRGHPANNRGTMMGWIGNSQAIKPNNRMPPYTLLTSEQLTGLAAYLEAQR